MNIPVLSSEGKSSSTLVIESDVTPEAFNKSVIHEITTMELAGMRSGTSSTKTRGEVSGGGRKPYRQKGTGRARQGSSRAPQWRGGAIIFGPRPRNYFYKQPSRKVLKALREALLVRGAEGKISIIPSLDLKTSKTKDFVSLLTNYNVLPGYQNILLISEELDENIWLASRNIPGITILPPSAVTSLYVVLSDFVLVAEDSRSWLEQFLKGAQ
ncbi:MAG: 50S ribosomal protein L4 [Leptospirales bacterium]|jgi:large subunit ribosomal protein L4